MTHSLFAHLTRYFAAGEENLATEALHYIFLRSDTARRTFLHLLRETGVSFPDHLLLKTQAAAGDGSIPDLVGEDRGERRLIVEAKFWAGLTENQPVTYVEQMPRGTGAVLLFLAPGQRFATLAAELRRRCVAAGLPFQERSPTTSLLLADLGVNRALALLSWRSLLSAIRSAVEAEHDFQTASDIAQLEGLCDRMDERAFHPFRSEELTGDGGHRLVQYCELVDGLAASLSSTGLGDGTGLRSAAGAGWYGRYLRISGLVCLLHFSAHKWGTMAATPFWLSYYAGNGKTPTSVVRAALAPLESARPKRLFLSEKGDLEIPLFVPVGMERDDVIKQVYAQVVEIGTLLATCRTSDPSNSIEET